MKEWNEIRHDMYGDPYLVYFIENGEKIANSSVSLIGIDEKKKKEYISILREKCLEIINQEI